jgi:hypothetical protein
MEERKRDDDVIEEEEEEEEVAFDIDDTLVEESDLEGGGKVEGNVGVRGKAKRKRKTGTSSRATLWVALVTISTLIGRRILTTGFGAFFLRFSSVG